MTWINVTLYYVCKATCCPEVVVSFIWIPTTYKHFYWSPEGEKGTTSPGVQQQHWLMALSPLVSSLRKDCVTLPFFIETRMSLKLTRGINPSITFCSPCCRLLEAILLILWHPSLSDLATVTKVGTLDGWVTVGKAVFVWIDFGGTGFWRLFKL